MKKITYYLLAFALLISACQERNNGNIPTRPNVLFILVDDLGVKDLSCAGSSFYETPNIDKIASQGVSFVNGYAASRVCSPSRASIMTGKFTARHGITDWIGAKSGEAWRQHNRHDKLLPAAYRHALSTDDITIAEAMVKAGYNTFFAGKWHLGNQGSYPEDHGFSINRGGWDKGSPIGGYFSPWENPRLENIKDGENLSLRLARETVDFITENKDTAFFAFLSFYAVHGPIQTTKTLWSKYRNKAINNGIAASGFKMEQVLPIRQVQDNPVYAGLVETTDKAIGLVLDALQTNGLDENTIIIFTSDNGGVSSGDAFSTSNLPFRGGKGYQWEGGIREPYFIKVPWINKRSETITYPVTGTDFYPTILDLAGIQLNPDQHVDGISLKPLLEGKELPQRPLFWHYPHYGNQGGAPSSIIRDGDWKLIHYWEDDRDELYNLNSDPIERVDVFNKYPAVGDSLSSKLKQWLKEVNANHASPDTTYDIRMAAARHQHTINELWPQLENRRKSMLAKDFQPNENWWGSQTTKD